MTIAHARGADDTRVTEAGNERRANCYCDWEGDWYPVPARHWDSPTPSGEWRTHMQTVRDGFLIGSYEAQDVQELIDEQPSGRTMGEFVESFRAARMFGRGESTQAFMQRTDPVGYQQCRDAGRF